MTVSRRGRFSPIFALVSVSLGVVPLRPVPAPAASAPVAQRTEQQKIVAGDAAADDEFGFSVDVYGDTMVIGSPRDDDNGTNSGSAYVYERTGPTWSFAQKLTASDGAAFDDYGHSVAVNGDLIAVGAPQHDRPDVAGSNDDSGSAYVYRFNGTSWVEEEELLAGDPAGADRFGNSVDIGIALPADFPSPPFLEVVVGAPLAIDPRPGVNFRQGAIYTFDKNAGFWQQRSRLSDDNETAVSELGNSVAINKDAGDRILGGASSHDDPFSNVGAAYAFRRQGILPTTFQDGELLAADPNASDALGFSVDIDGPLAVVGAPGIFSGAFSGQGAVYVFEGCCASLITQQKLTAADGVAGDVLGFSVAVQGDTIAAGAPGHDGTTSNDGAAYLFRRNSPNWRQIEKLVPSDPRASADFGNAVALSRETLAIGAHGDDFGRGAVYIFGVPFFDTFIAATRW